MAQYWYHTGSGNVERGGDRLLAVDVRKFLRTIVGGSQPDVGILPEME